ncbi:MAG: hypothetical protein HQL07_10130 [Nitrospirae bacterium]|nr:hypothetical protein [Magnetococcales bacterium]HAT50790.1 hypothetical protein [Alphaproteobacteria bacterium]
MIKIEIIGPNGENLLGGTLSERVRRLGLPVLGLLGGMVLSFFLANSLVTSDNEIHADASQEVSKTFRSGVSYPLPTEPIPNSAPNVATITAQIPHLTTPSAQSHTLTQFTGNKKVITLSSNMTPPKRDAATSAPSKGGQYSATSQALDSDPLLDERIQAAKTWLTAHNNSAIYSVQLMSVHRSSLGGLQSYLNRSDLGLSADKLMAFPVDQDRLLLFYGQYATREEANQAIASLPASIRNTGPFALSGKNIEGKLARLNKDTEPRGGLVAALKQ